MYDLEVASVFVGGSKVFDRADETAGIGVVEPAAAAAEFASQPTGWTPSPVIGYDPVPGLILGAALFVYPYRPDGLLGNVQIMVAPMQGARLLASTELAWLRGFPNIDVKLSSRFENWQGRYYGVGIDTAVEDPLETDLLDVESSAGLAFHLADNLQLYTGAVHGVLYDEKAGEIAVRGGAPEGPVEGHRVGTRLQLTHDTREGMFSPRFGGLRSLWAEWWPVEGSEELHRGRAGLELSQFIPLYKPDVVLALRGLGGVSLGEPSYATNYRLGGIMLAYVGGAGLRFGLPTDFLIKLRFDVGFGRDQWGIFFNFNEAF